MTAFSGPVLGNESLTVALVERGCATDSRREGPVYATLSEQEHRPGLVATQTPDRAGARGENRSMTGADFQDLREVLRPLSLHEADFTVGDAFVSRIGDVKQAINQIDMRRHHGQHVNGGGWNLGTSSPRSGRHGLLVRGVLDAESRPVRTKACEAVGLMQVEDSQGSVSVAVRNASSFEATSS